MQNSKILAQRSMGTSGLVTKPFRHLKHVNKQICNQQSLSFKMTPRIACHPWSAAKPKNRAFLGFGYLTMTVESRRLGRRAIFKLMKII